MNSADTGKIMFSYILTLMEGIKTIPQELFTYEDGIGFRYGLHFMPRHEQTHPYVNEGRRADTALSGCLRTCGMK